MISQPVQNLRDEQEIRLQRFHIQYISKQEKEEAKPKRLGENLLCNSHWFNSNMYGTDQLLFHSYCLHQLPARSGGKISMSYISQRTEFLSQDPQTSSAPGNRPWSTSYINQQTEFLFQETDAGKLNKT